MSTLHLQEKVINGDIVYFSNIDGYRLNSNSVNPGDGQTLWYDGTTLYLGSAAVMNPNLRIVAKTVDTTIVNSSTRVGDPELILSVEANTNYILEYFIRCRAHSLPDFRYSLFLPTGATALRGQSNYVGTATNANIRIDEPNTQLIGGTNITRYSMNTAYIAVGATAGNLQFAWAQSSPDPNASYLYAGTYLRLYKL